MRARIAWVLAWALFALPARVVCTPAAAARRSATHPPAALVLYGRVGTYAVRTASMKKGKPGSLDLWRNCAETIATKVLTPWRAAGRVDVFVQSWNPEMADAMDAFWQPAVSAHAAQNYSLGTCPKVKLNYCDRTMWAMLGLKIAVGLRAGWAAGAAGRAATPHATVLVMRHDVYWKAALPPLRADRAVRLWLPFDCRRDSCRDDTALAADAWADPAAASAYKGAPPRARCKPTKGKAALAEAESGWTLVTAPRTVLSVNCHESEAGEAGARGRRFCGSSVNVDWWWAGDAALADGFGATFDDFGDYSRLIRHELDFKNSAPHHYWGLYFFHTHQLRARCELGHAGIAGSDFTLGRFVPNGSSPQPPCPLQGWRPIWRPPTAHRTAAGGGQPACNASAIPGYLTMCPGLPSHPLRKRCDQRANASSADAAAGAAAGAAGALGRRVRAGDAGGGGGGGRGGGGRGGGALLRGNRTRASPAHRLRELTALRDAGLASESDFTSVRQRILDKLVADGRA